MDLNRLKKNIINRDWSSKTKQSNINYIKGKLKVFPSKLKLSDEKLNYYLLQCMKSNFFDKIEKQFIMEGI